MKTLRKYPRTPHLPWSKGGTSDDAYLFDVDHFAGKEVVVTEKMDGENTTMYRDAIHARSLDSQHHPSRDWVKALHGMIATELPEHWRFCGENVYAQHSIVYQELSSYFYLFSVWNEENVALSWDETLEWANLLSLETVPVLYRGVYDSNVIDELTDAIDTNTQEGYVIRLAERFQFEAFGRSIAKWVRKGHVQTDQHWMHAPVVPNGLKNEIN